MLNSLKSKIVLPIVGILVLMIAVIVVYVSTSTADLVDRFEHERMDAAIQTVHAYIGALERQTSMVAAALGGSAELIQLIDGGNRDAIWQYAFDIKTYFGVGEIIIGSADGFTLARSHLRDSYGDDISGVPSVNAALNRQRITMYTPTPTAYMVMTSTSPILDGDRLVGSVVVNYVVGSNDFLDELGRMFSIDLTVFNRAGESVASTLIHPQTGGRAVGTTARQDIIDTVIGRGQTMQIDLPVFDFLPYMAYYFPLPGLDRTPNGMFFVGISLEHGEQITSAQQMYIIIIGIIGLAVAALLTYFWVSHQIKPIHVLQGKLSEVTAGNININMDRANIAKDEIGALTSNVYNLVDVIRDIIDDLGNIDREYNKKGKMDYRADASKYNHSFKELIDGVNSLCDAEVTNLKEVIRILEQISDGNFNITVADLPGDRIALSQAYRAVATDLQAVSAEVNQMIDAAAVKGQLNYQVDATKYQGDWSKIMRGLNDIAAAVDKPLSEIKETMGRVSQAIFDTKIRGDYAGDFLEIKNAVNGVVDSLSKYIKEIDTSLTTLASGDLSRSNNAQFSGDFKRIGESINHISSSLHKTMSEIMTASSQVLSGAKQISTSAMDLANGAQQQASSIEELNASIDVINQQTQQNAASAMEASALSRKSTENANAGNETMKQMLDAMEQIKDSSAEISKIIKAIQDITFQTNLLSLNASVEAARAGEHGRGFAVVADEVRNLASKSQQSTIESTDLINQSIERVDAGSTIAETTSESLAVIVKNAGEILEIINSISASSKEQADSISQISTGLAQISSVVQSNSAVSQETAAASQELNSQAEVLQQLVSFFRL
ncbi:MAG: methyl-accepting chemotaxis protein [Defluviitaleaceae bacterium]|nr:methyl-accepting chemotaxis protein [Defluviitaleaceae bacterium]MCL2275086.1 methyl-accepting chemotaxis protein [Defluviitaleaceae bacterium]